MIPFGTGNTDINPSIETGSAEEGGILIYDISRKFWEGSNRMKVSSSSTTYYNDAGTVVGLINDNGFNGNGSQLTALNATSLTGTINNSRLNTDRTFSRLYTSYADTATYFQTDAQVFMDVGSVEYAQIDKTDGLSINKIQAKSGTTVAINDNLNVSGVITGNGSGLTALNATNIGSGTINNSRLPSTISVSTLIGDGSGLTGFTASQIPNLDATKITSGTLSRPISTSTGLFSSSLGIGTSSPLRPLHVEDGGVFLQHTDAFYQIEASIIYERALTLEKRAGSHSFKSLDNLTTFATLNSSGLGIENKLGVGVAPNNAFSIDLGTAGGNIRATTFYSSSASHTTFYSSYGIDHALTDYSIDCSTAGKKLILTTNNSEIVTNSPIVLKNTAGAEQMRLDTTTGNMGIGTSSPQSKLHIVGDSVDADAVDPSANPYAQLEITSATNNTGNTGKINLQVGADHNDALGYGFLQTIVNNIHTASLRLQPYGGNVGIGNINPTEKLDVLGTIKATALKTAYGSTGTHIIGNNNGADNPVLSPSLNNKGYVGTSALQFYEIRAFRLYTDGVQLTSDDRLKHNEEEIIDALGTINKLKLYKYDKTQDMLDADFNGDLGDLTHHKEIGFIAQEVAEIPELTFLVDGGGTTERVVSEADTPEVVELPFNLNYNGITNLAVQAIQELSAQLELLKQEVAVLKAGQTSGLSTETQTDSTVAN